MARTARTKTLTALDVKHYSDNPSATKPLHDGGGLYLRKRDSGCYWYLRLTEPATGKEQWHRMFADDPLCGFPDKSLLAARTEASRLWSIRDQGIDPRAQRQQDIRQRQAAIEAAQLLDQRRLTIRQLFDRWADTELKPHIRADGSRTGRKDGGQYLREQFERHVFPLVGVIAAPDVRKTDLIAIFDTCKTQGKLRTANVLLAGLKQMFRFALAREIIERNPLDTVTKRDAGGAEVERERVLTKEEIKALAKKLPEACLSPRGVCAIWLILATGCRVGELMKAQWDHVDLTAHKWHLPDTKNGRNHTIHLSDFAQRQFETLATLKTITSAGLPCPWVFPSSSGDNAVDIKAFGKQLADRQRPAEAQIKGRTKATTSLQLKGGTWTAHDLRRTAATIMAQLGISGDVIDECLNHVIESRVRRTYIRDRRPSEQAKAFDALGAQLERLTSLKAAEGNVVNILAA